MRVGIVVDGDAESQALKLLTRRLVIQGVNVVDPVYANMQPKSTPAQIAKSAEATISILLNFKNVHDVIVLIDREDQQACPTELALNLEGEFTHLGFTKLKVIIKDRCFENWLVADPAAFREHPKRFRMRSAFARSVQPNRADFVKAPLSLLNTICRDGDFHKRKDASLITRVQTVESVARNSRSFRRFLRIVGHESYLTQSRLP